MIFKMLFSRKWWPLTILGIFLAAGMVRLGIWQLDRLSQRRSANSQVLTKINAPPLRIDAESLSSDLSQEEYRKTVLRGEYDLAKEVLLANQEYHGQVGFHLLAPLHIEGTEAFVLIDRGWIPASDAQPEAWSKYAETGTIEVSGVIRNGDQKSGFGSLPTPTGLPGESRQTTWLFINLKQIAGQMDLELLPVYIQASPNPTKTQSPSGTETELDLTEGPHLGYALQWFTFAAIALAGVPIYIYREEQRTRKTNG